MIKRAIGFLIVVTMIFFSADLMAEEQKTEKKAIVLAGFGTSYPQALSSVLKIKDKMTKEFPNIPVQIAFTSKIIRSIWAERADDPKWRKEHPDIPLQLYSVKNPLATIADLQDQGYQYIAVQSTHIFAGEEYENLKAEIKALDSIQTLRYRDKPFKKIFLGRPALGEAGDQHPYQEDILRAAGVLGRDVEPAKKNKSALVYMGHGNEIFSTGVYLELEAKLRDSNPNVPIFIGNVEGFPGPEQVLQGLKHAGIKKVTLIPFMVVAGDHAVNDMAGEDKESWKSLMEKDGIEVITILRGLGEVDEWVDIYVQNLKDAMRDNEF
ncbi:MAG: sirohydrochlorin cobaltochelatase [Desulfobacterales bacterium]|nr:sirohydrochlorin cobaltochelatase [Desulfobacterales bacterium]